MQYPSWLVACKLRCWCRKELRSTINGFASKVTGKMEKLVE